MKIYQEFAIFLLVGLTCCTQEKNGQATSSENSDPGINFRQEEPTQIMTPPADSTDKEPLTNFTQVLVSTNDKDDVLVFLSFFGENNKPNEENILDTNSSESFRKRIIENVVSRYETLTGDNLDLKDKDFEEFAKVQAFGVPMEYLKEFLNCPDKDEYIKVHMNDSRVGIPLTPNPMLKDGDLEMSEFQLWLQALLNENVNTPENIEALRKDGSCIALKADFNISYSQITKVMEEMREIDMNKFTLMTSLKK